MDWDDHYEKALHYLARAEASDGTMALAVVANFIAAAQVHATLCLALRTVEVNEFCERTGR